MQAVILEFLDQIIPGKHCLLAGKSYGGYLARGILKARPAQVDGLLSRSAPRRHRTTPNATCCA